MKILGTGLTGLVGSRIIELLGKMHQFDTSHTRITNKQAIISKIQNSDADVILHFAAKTDVDGCENDKVKDIGILKNQDIQEQEEQFSENNTAWAVNVFGTQNIIQACEKSNRKLIYISTDFVFDGIIPQGIFYTEEDIPCSLSWYGQTKLEGENCVKKAKIPWVIIRISYPYRANFTKIDFFRAILKRLKNQQPVKAIVDQTMTPTFIDDIAFGLNTIIQTDQKGIFHACGNQQVTPFEAAQTIAKVFKLDSSTIQKVTGEEYFKNRAQRPFNLSIKNDKIQKLGIEMRSFEQGLEEIKNQLNLLIL